MPKTIAVYFIETRTFLRKLNLLMVLHYNSFVKCENALDSCEIYNPCVYTEEPKSVPGRSLSFRSLEVGALPFYNLCRWQIPIVHLRAI